MLPTVCPLCRIALPLVDDVCPRDGHTGLQVAWLPVPASLSRRFQVLEPFGHGHSGSLYIADEPETGRRGLLKILAPSPNDQLAERQRLRRELVKQATLTRTHLVVPLASGESEGVAWIFREWLDGVALEVRLSREGALQQTEALAIAAQIASALDELHRGGLLHRDVKPGHIFLQPTPNGIPRALLLDAGLANVFTTEAGVAVHGSPGYVAPEQLLGKLVSFRSDLYSLGCVLYRMLTGRPAFTGDSVEQTLAAQRYGELPPAPAGLPNGIGALLQSILAKDPQQRPFSAQKLRRTLDPFLPDGALMEKQPTTTFETVPEPSPSIAPASGTLKPPPPPSLRPSLPASAETDPVLKPRVSSAPPPAPPSRKRPREENTQQIDIAQLEELAAVPRRAASVPPPTPGGAKATLPPPPTPPRDNTQPIRLDQIIAVENARRAATSLPPKPLDADATGVFTPKHAAPASTMAESAARHLDQLLATQAPEAAPQSSRTPEAALRPAAASKLPSLDDDAAAPSVPAQQPALFGVQDEPFDAPAALTSPADRALPAPLFQTRPDPVSPVADTVLQVPAVQQLPAMPQLAMPAARPSPAHVPEGAARTPSATDSQTSTSTDFRKATLLGMGSDSLDLSAPFAPSPVGRSAAGAHADSEADDSSERLPQILAELEEEDDEQAAAAASSMPAGTLSSSRVQRRDSRRLLMYASAALVGLAVLSVAASALRSQPQADASGDPTHTPPALPAVAAEAASSPTAVEAAQAPRPTVQPLAPSTAPVEPSVEQASADAPAHDPVPPATVANAAKADSETTGAAAASATKTSAAASAAPASADRARTTPVAAEAAPATKPVPAATPVTAPTPAVAKAVAKADHAEPAEPKVAREHHDSASKHGSSESHASARSGSGHDKERAKSAKTSPAEKKASDKAALFAAARDEARSAYAAKRYKDAALAYEQAAKYDPKHAGTYAGLGAARLQQGDPAAAVQAYLRAVQLSPDTSGFHAALGRAYLSAGDKAKAAAAYKRALALDPNNEAAKVALKQLH